MKEERLFSGEEEVQLQTLLQLSPTQLQQIISLCAFTFQQAAYFGLTAQSLEHELLASSASPDQVAAFLHAWAVGGPLAVKRLMSQTSGGAARLKGVEWRVKLQNIQSEDQTAEAKPALPATLLELSVAPQEGKLKEDKLVLELSREQLHDLFMKLERVQDQLDALAS